MSHEGEIAEFLARSGWGDAELFPRAGDASFRHYIRLKRGAMSAMLMDAPPAKENVRPYIAIAEHLFASGYSAPNILARDEKAGLLLLEDLGDDTFSAELNRDAKKERALYEVAVDLLAEWQTQDVLKKAGGPPLPIYDEILLMREVLLFSNWYMPQVLGKNAAIPLQEEYKNLWRDIIAQNGLQQESFVHRDYHADNLMWLPKRTGAKRVGLLDFQDGVYGDPAYDLVSLLEDARRDVPPALAEEMLVRYVKKTGTEEVSFRLRYAVLGAQRNSKIIGIFTRLAARDGKQHYLKLLPRVWGLLERDLAHPSLIKLKTWLDKYIAPKQRGVITIAHDAGDLALTA